MITPTEALHRCVGVLRLVDFADCKESEELWQKLYEVQIESERVLAQPAVAQWKPLNDVQWMNIVNHDHAYDSWGKEEAVHHAVKMTEAKCKEVNAALVAAQSVPEGWQLVPKNPTAQMILAAEKADDEGFEAGRSHGASPYEIYYAMLDSAPPTAAPVSAADAWQPIETAPRDGSRFLGALHGEVGFWHWQDDPNNTGRPVGWRDSFIFVSRVGEGPTLWMPIPAITATKE
jgi:hypothetical protein